MITLTAELLLDGGTIIRVQDPDASITVTPAGAVSVTGATHHTLSDENSETINAHTRAAVLRARRHRAGRADVRGDVMRVDVHDELAVLDRCAKELSSLRQDPDALHRVLTYLVARFGDGRPRLISNEAHDPTCKEMVK